MRKGVEFSIGPSPRPNPIHRLLRPHKPDLQSLRDSLERREQAILREAWESGHSVKPGSEAIVKSRVSAGFAQLQTHIGSENALLVIVAKIERLQGTVRDYEAFLTNPYIDMQERESEVLKNKVKRSKEKIRQLETDANYLRKTLTDSNNELPEPLRLPTHIPVADEGSGEA